jgi:hypothetical protein
MWVNLDSRRNETEIITRSIKHGQSILGYRLTHRTDCGTICQKTSKGDSGIEDWNRFTRNRGRNGRSGSLASAMDGWPHTGLFRLHAGLYRLGVHSLSVSHGLRVLLEKLFLARGQRVFSGRMNLG